MRRARDIDHHSRGREGRITSVEWAPLNGQTRDLVANFHSSVFQQHSENSQLSTRFLQPNLWSIDGVTQNHLCLKVPWECPERNEFKLISVRVLGGDAPSRVWTPDWDWQWSLRCYFRQWQGLRLRPNWHAGRPAQFDRSAEYFDSLISRDHFQSSTNAVRIRRRRRPLSLPFSASAASVRPSVRGSVRAFAADVIGPTHIPPSHSA